MTTAFQTTIFSANFYGVNLFRDSLFDEYLATVFLATVFSGNLHGVGLLDDNLFREYFATIFYHRLFGYNLFSESLWRVSLLGRRSFLANFLKAVSLVTVCRDLLWRRVLTIAFGVNHRRQALTTGLWTYRLCDRMWRSPLVTGFIEITWVQQTRTTGSGKSLWWQNFDGNKQKRQAVVIEFDGKFWQQAYPL